MSQDVSPRNFAPVKTDARGPGRPAERWIDDELAQSFPASDPPSWTMGGARPAGHPSATPTRRSP